MGEHCKNYNKVTETTASHNHKSAYDSEIFIVICVCEFMVPGVIGKCHVLFGRDLVLFEWAFDASR